MNEFIHNQFVKWWEQKFGGNITDESFVDGKWTYEPMQDKYEAFMDSYNLALITSMYMCEKRACSLPPDQCLIARLVGRDIKSLINGE